ncbi:MAG: SusC/RagA family TonB-linked outer membrane protein [Bacteroidales bacterium]|jgi:TonB-linked SusC/RagA family outer membrane protein
MKKILLLTLSVIMGISVLYAQQKVTGTVISTEDGDPLPFVTVVVTGTTIATQTNADGTYSINVPASGKSLTFTFIGKKTVVAELNGRTIVNVQLASEAVALEDVIVVAYGTAKKESFTGSAQVVKADKIEKRTISNVTKALDGLATGVQTTSGSGQPGEGSSVVIRGFGSISASNKPLYVVDGVPYDGAINAINPNDIESMTIIKDASAGALYGARGANGVIMITTKKGKEGDVTISFKGNWGIASRGIPRYNTLDSYGWTEDVYFMYKNKLIADGTPPSLAGAAALQEMATGATKIFGANQKYNPFSLAVTDLIDHTTGKIKDGTTLKWNENWLDSATEPQPLRQEYQMTVSGGSARTNYMFSAGYLKEEGLVLSTNFNRYSGRANIDSKVKDWFKTGFNVNFAANSSNSTSLSLVTTSESSTSYSNVFYTCMLMAPIYPLYEKDADGKNVLDVNGDLKYDWGEDRPAGASAGWNPLANLKDDKYTGTNDNVSARTYFDLGGLKEGFLQGLKFSVNFGFDYSMGKTRTYWNPYYGNSKSLNGFVTIKDERTLSYTFNQILSWNRSFGRHNVDFMAGHELYKYNYQYLRGDKSGFPFGGLYELDAATTIQDASSYTNNYVIESYLSRLNYNFNDKYYLSGSFRRDGTSRFNKSVRWGDFGSIGGSWRISQEPFMKGLSWLNNLTLKASYGVQGNDNIGSLYAWQAFYSLAYPNGSNPGAVVTSLENANLKWEKNENLNVGIEARLLDKLSFSAEYYNRFTRDMLMEYPMALSLGFKDYSKNIGNMQNSGFEVTVSMDIIKKGKLNWNMTLMGSTVKNKVKNLADKPEIISGNYIKREGETINSFYLAHSAGIDPATGNKLYWVWDEDDEGVRGERYISSDYSKALQCRDIAGSRIPKVFGSWVNDLRVGNFDLSFLTTFSIGGKMLDGVYSTLLYNTYVGQAAHVDRESAWKKPGDIVSIPRIDSNGSAKITNTADDLIDASYFAIKNITLGYSLPSRWMKLMKFQGARITLTADNLYVFTALKGMDPQYNFTGGTGFSYTPARTISVGLNLNL